MSCVLYRIRDAEGKLLYIGITGARMGRFAQHNTQPWWDQVATINVEHCEDRADALKREAVAITNECPEHNIVHGGPGRSRAASWTACQRCGKAIPEYREGQPHCSFQCTKDAYVERRENKLVHDALVQAQAEREAA